MGYARRFRRSGADGPLRERQAVAREWIAAVVETIESNVSPAEMQAAAMEPRFAKSLLRFSNCLRAWVASGREEDYDRADKAGTVVAEVFCGLLLFGPTQHCEETEA